MTHRCLFWMRVPGKCRVSLPGYRTTVLKKPAPMLSEPVSLPRIGEQKWAKG